MNGRKHLGLVTLVLITKNRPTRVLEQLEKQVDTYRAYTLRNFLDERSIIAYVYDTPTSTPGNQKEELIFRISLSLWWDMYDLPTPCVSKVNQKKDRLIRFGLMRFRSFKRQKKKKTKKLKFTAFTIIVDYPGSRNFINIDVTCTVGHDLTHQMETEPVVSSERTRSSTRINKSQEEEDENHDKRSALPFM